MLQALPEGWEAIVVDRGAIKYRNTVTNAVQDARSKCKCIDAKKFLFAKVNPVKES